MLCVWWARYTVLRVHTRRATATRRPNQKKAKSCTPNVATVHTEVGGWNTLTLIKAYMRSDYKRSAFVSVQVLRRAFKKKLSCNAGPVELWRCCAQAIDPNTVS